jgi:UDP:flavonoid glycosyltransferase YjiC (YdhE family)
LYADVPELTPLRELPKHQRFLGPVLWSPSGGALPKFLRDVDARPLVYVTLGSSGKTSVIPKILEGLSALDVRVVLATAGREAPQTVPANVEVHDFVRGDEVARAAALVISNGGSTTGYQALAAGTPVLGVPSNLDQCLATQAIEAAGAGLVVPARQASADRIRDAARVILGEPRFKGAAERVACEFSAYRVEETFPRFVDDVLGESRARRRFARAAMA